MHRERVLKALAQLLVGVENKLHLADRRRRREDKLIEWARLLEIQRAQNKTNLKDADANGKISYRIGAYMQMKKLEEYVRSIPDFPEPGIIFRDITTILQDADGLQLAIDGIQKSLEGVDYDIVVGPESRGFIFGVPVAYAMHKGFVPIRKKGKLPCKTVSVSYDLEYGSAVLEMHEDAIKPGQKVVIVDDLIATGGTTEAIVKLIEKMGGEVVKICCVMELAGLKGRERLKDYDVASVIRYDGK